MNVKRVLGFILLVGGIVLMLFSNYILNQVAEGKEKISNAESQVQRGNSLFSLNPVSKEVGKGIMGGAQNKIDIGKQQVGYYEDLAGKMHMGGIAAIALGLVLIFLSFKKKRK
jgi:hypothetical protein